ncbi:MAG: hypothetical protein R2865_14750 [Deinococcales bacterium]
MWAICSKGIWGLAFTVNDPASILRERLWNTLLLIGGAGASHFVGVIVDFGSLESGECH